MVPLFYAKVLVKEGFTAVQSDGESLVDMCGDPPFRQALLTKLLKEVPPPPQIDLRHPPPCQQPSHLHPPSQHYHPPLQPQASMTPHLRMRMCHFA